MQIKLNEIFDAMSLSQLTFSIIQLISYPKVLLNI